MCPVCALFFHTRQGVIRHIEHSCEGCRAALHAGLVKVLPDAQVRALDAEGAKERSEARERGVSNLALRGEERGAERQMAQLRLVRARFLDTRMC